MKKNILIIILSLFSITAIKAQEQKKDTLFFKLDKYLYQSKLDSKKYIIKGNGDTSVGAIYFEEYKIINNIKPKETLCFKKYAQSSKLYTKVYKKKLNEYKIIDLFNDFTIIIVNKKNKKTKFVEVGPVLKIQ